MHGTDSIPPRPWWLNDLLLAAGFLTRLPMPPVETGERPIMRTAWSFPIIGAAIGGIAGLVLWVALHLGLPAHAAAFIAIGATALLTGALHEDGLADLADGFGGGRDRAGKIAIMRDSRIGAYGVLALILATGLKASAITALLAAGDAWTPFIGLIAAHAVARAMIVPVAYWLQPASDSGLGQFAGRPKFSTLRVALGGAAAGLLILLPVTTALAVAAAGLLAAGGVAVLARRQIGGYTGDVLGGTEQAAEVAILLALAAASA
jgi:adenosylcobinamide-GDP ribazoletransferase